MSKTRPGVVPLGRALRTRRKGPCPGPAQTAQAIWAWMWPVVATPDPLTPPRGNGCQEQTRNWHVMLRSNSRREPLGGKALGWAPWDGISGKRLGGQSAQNGAERIPWDKATGQRTCYGTEDMPCTPGRNLSTVFREDNSVVGHHELANKQ